MIITEINVRTAQDETEYVRPMLLVPNEENYSQLLPTKCKGINYPLLLLLKPAAQAKVGRINLFINYFRNPTSTCGT